MARDEFYKAKAAFLAVYIPVLDNLKRIDKKTNWSVTPVLPYHLEHTLQVQGKVRNAISELVKLIYEVETAKLNPEE